MSNDDDEIEEYGDPRIASKDAPVPRWLIWTYCILPIVGLTVLFVYWNGSHGYLDRGYWEQLQWANNTKYPFPKPHPEKDKYP